MNLPWSHIDTILLDMDGTLLDKHFDDYFWEHFVPTIYAETHGVTEREARKVLLEKYKAREGTLDWTSLDYWSEQLQLDIPELKIKIDHLIGVHPYVIDFLDFCKEQGKKPHLVTNAHSKTLDIKMNKTALAGYFDRIICAEEIGVAKEDPSFWEGLQKILPYNKKRTMLAEDTEKILDSARQYGIEYLIFVARPSSTRPIAHSKNYPSIVYFNELMELT